MVKQKKSGTTIYNFKPMLYGDADFLRAAMLCEMKAKGIGFKTLSWLTGLTPLNLRLPHYYKSQRYSIMDYTRIFAALGTSIPEILAKYGPDELEEYKKVPRH